LDTRTKIIGFEEAVAIAEKQPVRWVTGHFDPLLVEHARRVREFIAVGQTLIVVVTNPEHPLLPLRARAELVAALAGVDYVVMKEGPGVADEPEDRQIAGEFIEQVLERHRA
jgi:bifunctional ADP-heptose synthase (sugar kinase/adenylyltransferase)